MPGIIRRDCRYAGSELYGLWTAGQRVTTSPQSTNWVWKPDSWYEMRFTYWNPGEPSNGGSRESCLNLLNGGHFNSFGWNDESCDRSLCSICELDLNWIKKASYNPIKIHMIPIQLPDDEFGFLKIKEFLFLYVLWKHYNIPDSFNDVQFFRSKQFQNRINIYYRYDAHFQNLPQLFSARLLFYQYNSRNEKSFFESIWVDKLENSAYIETRFRIITV